MDNFREITSTKEIVSLIRQADPLEMGQIWQTVDSLRFVYAILDIKIDDEHGAIVFQTQLPFEFDRTQPIYVRITNRNLIFKLSGNYVLKHNRLICTYPEEAKALEMRHNERLPVPKDRIIPVVLKSLQTTSALEVRAKLRDFSKKGIGLLVSDVNQEYFQRIEIFSIVSIDGIEIGNNKAVHVRYVGPKERGFAKVGMALHEAFDDETFVNLQILLLS